MDWVYFFRHSGRRCGPWLALVVLPLVLLRLALPADVMPDVSASGASVTYCADLAPDSAHGAPGSHAHCPCPQSAGAAPPSAPLLWQGPTAPSAAAAVSFQTRATALSGPSRHVPPRAPPSPLNA